MALIQKYADQWKKWMKRKPRNLSTHLWTIYYQKGAKDTQ